MKKFLIILLVLFGASFLTVQSFGYEKIGYWIQKPFQISAEEKELKDWINYEVFLLNQNHPQLEPLIPVDFSKDNLDQIVLRMVKDAPKIIESNTKNIKKLDSINFISDEFKEIKALDIEALTIQNQLMQENIVDYYKKHQRTQSYLKEPALKLIAKSQYLLQQSTLKTLNHLKVLSFKNDKRLKSINPNELQDWIYYLEFHHQQNPKYPT